MNTPNKLTLLRILLTPIFLILLMIPQQWAAISCIIIFALASITDAVDGYIARKYNQVTTFGKFMDPIADKVLTTAAFIGFVELQIIPAWVPVIIIAREFLVTSMRILAISEGIIIPASIWGKLKTVSQLTAIPVLLLERLWGSSTFGLILVYVSLVMTVISGYTYIKNNWKLLKFK